MIKKIISLQRLYLLDFSLNLNKNIEDKLIHAREIIPLAIPFISQDDSRVISHWEDRYQHKWIDQVSNMGEEERFHFDGLREFEMIEDHEWMAMISSIKHISNTDSLETTDMEIGNIPGKKKKRYELKQLYSLLEHDKKKSIADFGGGIGNSSSFFHDQLSMRPSVFEQNEELIKTGKKKFNKETGKIDYFNEEISSGFRHDALKSIDIGFGLHTCGNFANYMLDSCIDSKMKKIINIGCCYSKITDDLYSISKLSQSYGPLELNRRALSIGTLSFGPTDRLFYDFRLKIMRYKYTFYHYLFTQTGEVQFLPMSNARRSLYDLSIDEFFVKTLAKFYPEFHAPSSQVINEFYQSKKNQDILNYFEAIYSLGRYFGELIESYIILDRAQYSQERGYLTKIVKVFDPQVSPRCKAIILENIT